MSGTESAHQLEGENRFIAEETADLRRIIAELRRHAEELPDVIQRVAAHHRPDVWRGGIANAFGRELTEQYAIIVSPFAGVTAEVRAAADRLAQRAATLDVRQTEIQLELIDLARSPDC